MAKIKKYVRPYIEEAYCDKCGAPMLHTGTVLTSNPLQYPFQCTNEKCKAEVVYTANDVPGVLRYEFISPHECEVNMIDV